MVTRAVIGTSNFSFTHYLSRKLWRAAGRVWVWYWDGTNIVYMSRPEGAHWPPAGGSWTAPQTVRLCDDRLNFGTWFDGTYFHYAYSQGNQGTPSSIVYYRRGLANADGSITWSAAEQTVQGHNESWRRRRLNVCVDDEGHPWISWQRVQKNGTHNYEPYLSTSTTTDGTWSTHASYPLQVRDTQSANFTSIVPMTSGQIMIFVGGGSYLYYRICSHSSTGSITQLSGYQADNRQFRHNSVSIGDIVYVCYQYGTAAVRFQVYDGSWSAILTPISGLDRPGLLSIKDNLTLMIFWNDSDIIKYKEYDIVGGSWGSEKIFQDETADTQPYSIMTASSDGEGYPFLNYATKAAIPYDMIFAEWEPPYVDLPAEFVSAQWRENLLAGFTVSQWQENLHCQFIVRQESSVDLPAIFESQTSVDLHGEFIARQPASVNLLGTFRVQQTGTTDLKSSFAGQVTRDLLGAFFVNQGQTDLLGGFIVRHSGPMPWYSPGWLYQKSHTITGSVAGVQTDYQVGVKVYYGSGVDGTEVVDGTTFGKIYCDSKCRTDFGDIRFTRSDMFSPLDYWIEEQVDGDYAIIWVEVDSIPVSPGTVDIYLYYGNAGATTVSNGPATFITWNDCDDATEWDVNLTVGTPIWGERTEDGFSTIMLEVNANGEKIRLYYNGGANGGRENRRFLTRIKHDGWNGDAYMHIYTNRDATGADSDFIYYTSFNDEIRLYAVIGAVSVHGDKAWAHPSGWKRYQTIVNINGELDGWSDSTALTQAINDGNYVDGVVGYYVGEFGSGTTRIYVDWFAQGKYVDPEPTHTAWGPETSAVAVGGNLPAEFFVKQWAEDLPAEFDVGQGGVDLLSAFDVRHPASVDLLGEFRVRHPASVDLLGEFIVAQWQEDLHGQLIVRHTGVVELAAGFIVNQWQEDLHCRFRVENVYDLRGTSGIAFYWQGADNPPESIVDFIVESPTGFWVGEFYDGPASLRYVFIPWAQFRETGLDGSRPDMSRIDGFIWVVHTDGMRLIDDIHAPIFGDLLALFVVRHTAAAPRNLKASFTVRHSATPLNLGAAFDVRHVGTPLNLLAELAVRQESSVEVLGKFSVN